MFLNISEAELLAPWLLLSLFQVHFGLQCLDDFKNLLNWKAGSSLVICGSSQLGILFDDFQSFQKNLRPEHHHLDGNFPPGRQQRLQLLPLRY